MCSAHAAVRSVTAELVGTSARPTVVDIEAGLEHLSRGTARNVDTLLLVVEPYFKSMETGARMSALGRELGIPHVHIVANKLRGREDEEELRAFFSSRGLKVTAAVPADDVVTRAERLGVGPLDVSPSSPAIDSIAQLTEHLRRGGPGETR
jgi:CO dehydrogenase maturation factor